MKNLIFTVLLIFISAFSVLGQNKIKPIDPNVRIGDFYGIVYDICFSQSGQTLIIPQSNQICFYDIHSNALTRRFIGGHSKPILKIDLATDSSLLVSGGLDSMIVLWNVKSGEIVKRLNYHHGVITSLDLNPYGSLLASGSSDKTVVVYDFSNGKIAFKLENSVSDITMVKFSPDGQLLAVASQDKQIKLYDSQKGQLIATLDGHKNSVRDLCFNKEGNRLFSCGDDSKLIKWNIKNRNQITKEVESYGSDWLLSIDIKKDAYVVAGLNSRISVITNFATLQGKIGVPVNKILFVPNSGIFLKMAVATRGKGVFLMDASWFDFRN
jgi:WD40 repeat protein